MYWPCSNPRAIFCAGGLGDQNYVMFEDKVELAARSSSGKIKHDAAERFSMAD